MVSVRIYPTIHKGGEMNQSTRAIKGLGEASIRVNDLESMQRFYREVLGLEVLRREENYVFFKIAEGYAGHTQNLALFDAEERTFIETKSPQLNQEQTTLHHIALNISIEDFESEKNRLEGLGLNVRAVDHPWLHVRSLYFSDPEGNLLEFVCYDEGLG
jgi:catechol 2,3-dioxygenase-like lactoylglutathione lyase family enzyme